MFGRRKDKDNDVPEGEDLELLDEGAEDDRPAAPVDDEEDGGLTDRPDGPWDSSEVDLSGEYLDLGSLLLPPVAQMEVRIDMDEASGTLVGLTCVTEQGAVSIQPFAAPRSEGIWSDVRRELRQQITAGGGLVDEVQGPWGTEVRTQVPALLPDGTQGSQPARFAGIDGPRWFLRLVFLGPAAVDADAAAAVESIARAVVVVRDSEARAPGDLLPLRMPEQAQPVVPEGEDPAWQREDVSPFERGPEITEIR